MANEKEAEAEPSEFVEVHLLETVKTQALRPIGYTPTLMLKDNADRVIAIPIGQLNHSMMSEALDKKRGTYHFLLKIFKEMEFEIEGAFIYGVEGTSARDLKFLSRIKLKNISSNEVKFVTGDTGDIVSLALISKTPIYINKDIIDKASSKLRQS